MILTNEGYFPIKDKVDQIIKVWNGEEWSETTVQKTGTNQNLLKVNLSTGEYIECTPYHKFYIRDGRKSIIVEAKDLKIDDKLINLDLPECFQYEKNVEFQYAYTHGYWCGSANTEKELIFKQFRSRPKSTLKRMEFEELKLVREGYYIKLHDDIEDKYKVPLNSNVEIRLEWLAGLMDINSISNSGRFRMMGRRRFRPFNKMARKLQINSENHEFLLKVKLLIQTLGIHTNITKSTSTATFPDGSGGSEQYINNMYHLWLTEHDLYKLKKMGFNPLNKMKNVRKGKKSSILSIVSSIEEGEHNVDTYCFNEPKKHMGVFNGILTGNCTEIGEYYDENEIAVCNLASICLPKFVKTKDNGEIWYDYEELMKVSKIVTRNLDKIIDINYYPVEETKTSNSKNRPIGVGVQGLADVYKLFRVPFGSDEARLLNKKIFETIYFGCIEASTELALKFGPYERFKDSPFHNGKFQFNMWGLKDEDLLMGYNWKQARENVQKYGIRQSLLTTVMPTASTSQIMGNVEACEPQMSNIYERKTLAGEYIVINESLRIP